jgi:hypothetical protein
MRSPRWTSEGSGTSLANTSRCAFTIVTGRRGAAECRPNNRIWWHLDSVASTATTLPLTAMARHTVTPAAATIDRPGSIVTRGTGSRRTAHS